MDDHRDSLRSNSGIWLSIDFNTNVYQRYLDDIRDSVRSTSGSWMTIRIV